MSAVVRISNVVARALFLVTLGCSSKSTVRTDRDQPSPRVTEKPTADAPPAVTPATPVAGWPTEGLCATTKSLEDKRCRLLKPHDGAAIEKAIRAFLRSDEAALKHAKVDLDRAARFVAPQSVSRFGDKDEPQIGNYFVYLGKSDRHLTLENTVSMTDDVRWGYYFKIEWVAESWVVKSFGTSRDWGLR